jgi:hypothetical protein
LVGGGAPVVSGGDALDDDARERVTKAMASAACTNACRSDDEEWLEKLLAAVMLLVRSSMSIHCGRGPFEVSGGCGTSK